MSGGADVDTTEQDSQLPNIEEDTLDPTKDLPGRSGYDEDDDEQDVNVTLSPLPWKVIFNSKCLFKVHVVSRVERDARNF